jgi:hypothetical protein
LCAGAAAAGAATNSAPVISTPIPQIIPIIGGVVGGMLLLLACMGVGLLIFRRQRCASLEEPYRPAAASYACKQHRASTSQL